MPMPECGMLEHCEQDGSEEIAMKAQQIQRNEQKNMFERFEFNVT